MANNFDDFRNRFQIRSVRATHRKYDRFTYGQTASYYNDRDEIVEVDLPRNGFEELVNVNERYERLLDQKWNEAALRRQYPAVDEAYSKYLMLLELYK